MEKRVVGQAVVQRETKFSGVACGLLAVVMLAVPLAASAGTLSALPSVRSLLAINTRTPAAVSAGKLALRVDHVEGKAVCIREGRRAPLKAGTALRVGDVVELAQDGRALFTLGSRGQVVASGGTHVVVETAPTITQPNEPLILNLRAGGLHAQWQTDTVGGESSSLRGVSHAPLYVYVAARRVTLQAGEYFVNDTGGEAQVCVVSGAAALRAVASAGRSSVVAGSCLHVGAKGLSKSAFTKATQMAEARNFELGPASTASPPSVASAEPARMTAERGVPKTRDPGQIAESAEEWAINVASYQRETDADQQRQHLEQAGYSAAVVVAQVDGQQWYRVQLTGFSSRGDAHARVARLERSDMVGRHLWVTRRR